MKEIEKNLLFWTQIRMNPKYQFRPKRAPKRTWSGLGHLQAAVETDPKWAKKTVSASGCMNSPPSGDDRDTSSVDDLGDQVVTQVAPDIDPEDH